MSVSKAWQEVAQAVLEGSRVALENRQYNRLVPLYAEMGLSENELRSCLRWNTARRRSTRSEGQANLLPGMGTRRRSLCKRCPRHPSLLIATRFR